MDRRLFTTGLGAALAGVSLPSIGKAPVDVVKVLSFSCSFCKESEVHDKSIAHAVREGGGRFVWAPVPTHPDDTVGAKERVYYAARDIDQALGEAVKQSLYKGTQDQGQQLFDYLPIYTWLSGDLPAYEKQLNKVFERARSDEALRAMQRAIKLALSAGVDAVPCYLLLRAGTVTANYDRTHPQAPTLSALRELVLGAVRKAQESKE